MSDALSKKLDEIEAAVRDEVPCIAGAKCNATCSAWMDCTQERTTLALVAALKAGLAVRAWDEESRERYDDTLKAIEELKL